MGEGGKPVEFLKDGQVTLGMGDGLEAAEVLVMVVEAADDAFDGIIGGWDQVRADAVEQPGPMALQEVKDDCGLGAGLDIVRWMGLSRQGNGLD